MDYERLQKLNDQRRYIDDIKYFKKNFEQLIIKGEHPESIKVTVETNYRGAENKATLPFQTENLRSPYDGCPLKDSDIKIVLDSIDGIIEREEKVFKEM
jgi:hypothetical protein